MAGQPLKLSAVVTLDASQVPAGARATKAEIAGIGTEAAASTTKLQQLINAQAGLGSPAANQNVREWSGALAMQGRSLDELRAKYNPLFAVINQYKTSLTEIRTLHAQGVLSTNEMTAAIQRQRQATLAAIDVIKGRNAALADQPAIVANGGAFQTANIAAQFQDIGVTAAMGMSPLQIALQQGTQLSSVLATMDKPVLGLAAAFRSLVSPVSLVTIGLVAASAAAIQYFMQSQAEADKASDALDKHGELIRRLRDAYGDAAKGARDYAAESRKILTQDTADQAKNYRKVLTETSTSLLSETSALAPEDFQGRTYILGQMQAAIAGLRQSAATGTPDIAAFVERLISIENHPAVPDRIRELSEELREAAKEGLEAQRALGGLLQVTSQIGASQRGFVVGSQGESDYFDYLDKQRLSLEQMRKEAAARQLSLNARSPQERADAARATAAARSVPDESADENRLRIELAGTEALASAEKELADARRDRVRSLAETVASQRLELQLIGRTVSEAEALRMEFQLTSDLKAEAARNGVEVDQRELALIREKARAYGQLAEEMAAINIIRDQQTELETLRAEISLVGQSEAVRRRSLALLQAEQMIRRDGIAANSASAAQIRSNAAAMADMETSLDRATDAWDRYRSAGEGAIDTIFDGLASGDFDFGQIARDLVGDLSKTYLELSVKNPLKNALFGTNYGTLDDLLNPSTAIGSALGSNVGAMTVNAATVMINGGLASGLGGLSDLGGAANSANDNRTGGYSGLGVGSVVTAGANRITSSAVDLAQAYLGQTETGNTASINSFLSAGGVDINAAQTAWCAGFVNSALKQIGVDGSGSLVANSFQNWGRRVDASQVLRGDVLLQSRGLSSTSTGGHVGLATGASRLSEGQLQLQMLSGNSSDSVANSWVNASELQVRRATEASSALSRLSSSAGNTTASIGGMGNGLQAATNGLGQFGSGLSQFGATLSKAMGGSTGGMNAGGIFSSLSGAGWNMDILGSSPQVLGAVMRGSWGLWNDGGYTGPGGKYDPAGIVHRGEIVWSQADIARWGGVQAVEKLRLAPRGYSDGGVVGGSVGRAAMAAANSNTASRPAANFNISLDGARGDREIEEAARRGMESALRAYDAQLPDRMSEIEDRKRWR